MRRFLGIFTLWNTRHYADSRYGLFSGLLCVCVCVYIFLTKKAEIENKASPLPFLTIALNMYRKYPHSRNFLRQLFIVFDNSLTKHLELRSALYAMYKTEKWVLYPRHSVFSHSVL